MPQARVGFAQVERLVQRLAAAFNGRHLYGAGHDRARELCRKFLAQLRDLLAKCGVDEVSLGVRGGRLEFGGVPLTGGSSFIQIAALLEDREVGGISLQKSLRDAALDEFLDWLRTGECDGERAFLGIELLEIQEEFEEREDPDSPLDPADLEEFRMSMRVYQGSADVLERAHRAVHQGEDLDIQEIDELTRWTAEQAMLQGTRLLSPIQLIQRDSYTWQHSVNVYLIASTLLRPLAKDHHELARFARSALLHDIGKSLIPESILHKKGRLTVAEMNVMRRHPALGAQILASYREIDAIDVEVAYCHHMRDNGLGYPVPKFPFRPGPVTNVVQVADMFEALTAHRPYKASISVEQAVDAIQRTPGMESKQAAMWLLMSHLTVSPPGSEVILASGERGVVLTTRPDEPARPMVMLMTDREGHALCEPTAVDLHEERHTFGGEKRYVEKVILRFGGRVGAIHA